MTKIIVILGPTGVGKTKLSIELAKKIDGEIINADSTQVYRGLDIATAKVKKKEMEEVPHHLIDICNINDNYTVYDYQKDCRKCIADIISRKKTPILVGGTGLYIKAALYDYKFDEELENNDFNNLSNEEILKEINKIDSNHDIHVNNRKRLVRRLNKLKNNEAISDNSRLIYESLFIGLTTDRNRLYDVINHRVDSMIENGLLEEARQIYNSKVRTKAIMTPIGYKELFPYFDNSSSLEDCISIIKQKSRKYAKRQYTWFNNQMDVNWFNVNYDNFNETIEEVIDYINNN